MVKVPDRPPAGAGLYPLGSLGGGDVLREDYTLRPSAGPWARRFSADLEFAYSKNRGCPGLGAAGGP
eukprot:8902238-Pyramimonas_sp.AAC.2